MVLTWWLRRTKERLERARPARGAKSRRPACRPAVEAMEDRITPAGRLFAIPPGNIIHELNPTTGAVINTIPAPEPTTNGVNGLAFDGSRLFFINGGGSDRLYELNPDTGAVVDSDLITAGSGDYSGLAVVAGQVYIQDQTANQIFVFDPATDTITRTLNPGVDLVGGLTGASGPGALIGPINGGNLIAEIDPTTGAVTNTFQPGFPNLLGAAYVGTEIYLGSGGSNTIFRYSRTGTFLGQITTSFPMAALGSDDATGGAPAPGPGSQFVNGDFEAGNTSGWTVFNQQQAGVPPSPGFQAYTVPNPSGTPLPAPPEGSFAAFANHNTPGAYILYQDVTLPAGQFHTLSLQVYYNNLAADFVTPNTLVVSPTAANQQFRIDVVDPTGNLLSTDPSVVLLNVFRTDAGEPNDQAPITLTADLTPFAGRVVRLRIAVADNIAPLYAAVDAVRLTSTGTAPTGTVTGVKFDDLDGDGVRDGNEPGLANWTIYADLNNNRRLDPGEPSATTAADGSYSITLPTGGHTIREVPQAGWVQTAPLSERLYVVRGGGGNGTVQTISEVDGSGAVLNAFPGPVPVVAVGPQGLAASGDSLFYIDGASTPVGSAGPHTLYELDPVTGAVLDADVLPATPDIAGLAYLNGLVYVQVYPTDQVLVFDPVADAVVRTLTVPADIIGGLTGAADLGLLFATGGDGRVYAVNPQSGGVVRAMNPGVGPLIGGLAYYHGELVGIGFATNPAFRIDPQTGAVLGTLTLGGTGVAVGLGGDGRLAGAHRVTLTVDQTVGGVDFGNRRDEGTVSGVKFNDLDGDGVHDGNEPGLPGWTIYADLNNNRQRDAGEPAAVTGPDGSYTLTLPAGTFSIREIAQPGWVQTSPVSYPLYATGFDGNQLITIDPAAGTAAVVGPFGTNQTWAGAFTPDGTYWTIVYGFDAARAQLARVDVTTGTATLVGGPNWTGSPMIALEADAAGNLYGGNFSGQFFRIDKTTGATTPVGPLGFGGVMDFAFDPAGTLWAVANNRLWRVNPATGAGTFVTPITGTDGEVMGLMIHPATGTFYVTPYVTNAALYTLDPATGTATRVGGGLGVPVPHGGDFDAVSGHAVTVTAGDVLTGRDFGNRRDEGTVSGVKYEDLDGDGTRDPGEAGLPGWTVYADLDDNGRLDAGEPAAVTGADGSYSLTVASGPHTIREVPQGGWVPTGPGGDRLFSLRPVTPSGPPLANIFELDEYGFVTNTFPAPAPVGGFGPQGLAVGPTSLFYVDSTQAGGPRLYELDPATGAVLDSDALQIPTATGLAYIGGLVYALVGPNLLFAFNPVSDTVVRVQAVTGAPGLFGGLTGAADLGLLFASAGSQIVAIDPVTGTVVRTLTPPGVGSVAGGLAYRNGELLGVQPGNPGLIFRINPVTGAVLGTLAPAGPSSTGLGGDGAPPGARRVTVTPGAVLAGSDFGNQRLTAPAAADDTASFGENGVFTVPAPGVLANDTGGFGIRSVVAVNGAGPVGGPVIALPSGSGLRVNGDGSYTYIPGPAFNALPAGATGSDSFTYTLADGLAATATATVRITITGANDAPLARPDTVVTDEDTPAAGDVLANDSDPDAGDTRSVVEVNGNPALVGQPVTLASGARLTLRADGTFDYDPSGAWDQLLPGQTAQEQFTYTVADAAGATAVGTVAVRLTGVNDGPSAADDAGDTDEDTPLGVAAPGVLGNDTDPDAGDTRTVTAVAGSSAAVGQPVTLPSGATITLRADGSYDYDPRGAWDSLRPGETATDVVEYTTADAAGVASAATLTLTVRGLNDVPVAADDAAATDEDTALTTAPSLLANDTDADHHTLLSVVEVNGDATAVGQPVALASGAVVTVFADGSYTYDPAGAFEALGPGQTATDSFTYTAADALGATSPATVTVTVTGVNDAPVARPDAYATDEDTELVVVLTDGILVNDTDVDGGALTAAVATGPAFGTVGVNPDGSFTYRPAADFNGTDSFTYTVSDGNGGSATGTVTITVRPVNDRPTLAGATFTVAENSPAGTAVGTVTGADVDGDTLRYQITGGNTAGAFAIDPATGAITVANAAALDFEATPVFNLTVEVSDPAGLAATATVTVRLTDVITPPRIDILPGDSRNRINSRSNGKISVAILSAAEFDARLIDVGSLRFGRTGQEDSVSQHPNNGPRYKLQDVNGDGRLDLVVEVEVETTGFRPGDAKGILTGKLRNGFAFTAEDAVTVV